MSLSSAYVEVTCDTCECTEDLPLTLLESGGWGLVDKALVLAGWVKDGEDKHICEGCADELRDELEMEESE